MRRRWAAVPFALVAAACGGGDGGSDRQAYVDVAAEALRGQAEVDFAADDVECLAEAVVDGIGVDRLDDAGVDPEDLEEADDLGELDVEIDEATARAIAERISGCELDLSGPLTEEITGRLGGAELSAGATACISDHVVESDALADAFLAGLLGGEGDEARQAGEEAGAAALGACPQAVTELFVIGIENQGITVNADAEACIAAEVEARADELGEALAGAAGDPAAAEGLGADIIGPCQGLLAG